MSKDLIAQNRSAAFLLITTLVCAALFAPSSFAQTGTSSWISLGGDGKLQYTPDASGNTIPDFSMVGYEYGEKPIPTNVPVVKTLTAISGDNLAQIQAAINEVAAMPLDGNGMRGAILLKAGEYSVSNTLNITASGIVLYGEGTSMTTGTRIIATRTAQHTLVNITGSANPSETAGTRTSITNSFVPVGAKSFTVASVAGYAVGDDVILRIEPKQAWIDLLDMAQYGWTPSGYNMSYHRTITKIEGNTVHLNAPVVDPIDVNLKAGYIYKFTWPHIENVGVENIRFSSVYSGSEDENHAWTAIEIDRAQHCWVRSCDFYHFGYSAVYVEEWGVNVSVINCQNLDPISITTGGRKYSFNLNGQLALFRNCYTRSGRHDYVTGSTTCGPNAFVDCKSDDMKADIGPHHRWATGLLFDNVVGSGEQNVQNRTNSGSGHGWAGAQTLFWNCTGSRFRNQKPPQHLNWAIGCKGTVTDQGNWVTGNPGIWESTGNFIAGIQSLYAEQLQDRLNTAPNAQPAVSITSPANNATFTNTEEITITASASDSDGTILKVEFFNGTAKLGEDVASPYTLTLPSAPAGTLNLIAKAIDDWGKQGTSSTVTVNVTAVPLPSPWENGDVGAVGVAGSTSYTNETFTLYASGADIWGSADEFHYVHQSVTGDVEIVAKVTSVTNTNAWTKAGVMIRETLNAGATHASVYITPVNGVSFQRRTSTGGTSTSATITGAAPVWLKMKRLGDVFTASRSSDGVTWTTIGSITISMAASVRIGLALTSHDDGTLANAAFSNVTVTPIEPVTSTEKEAGNHYLTLYPNPAKEKAIVSYQVQKAGRVTLSLLNASGNLLNVLVDGNASPGIHEAEVDLQSLSSGIHILQLISEGRAHTRKIVKK